MSVKRKRTRSKNRVEYIYTIDDDGKEVMFVQKNGVIVDIVDLHTVTTNENGEKVITIEKDGVQQEVLVDNFIADNGGKVKNIDLTDKNSYIQIEGTANILSALKGKIL